MSALGAVLIEGPKACGKTATASRSAATVFDMDQDETARASVDLNPEFLFDQPTPILFDEWQSIPELWNRVRRAVDNSGRKRGQYILTGSATPTDDSRRHSGAGRIGFLKMRPMSLSESGHSNGEVSLSALVAGEPQPGRDNGMSVPQIMERIIVGGWPDLLDADEADARIWLAGYLRQVIEVDVPSFVGRRDPRTLRRVISSLARFVAQSPATRSLASDAGGARGPIAAATVYNHLDALDGTDARRGDNSGVTLRGQVTQ
jgi:predicted AAA+ superfamily ATPase